MIKATELRIGNCLFDSRGFIRKVAYVGQTIGVFNKLGGTDKYQHAPIVSGDINDLKPIPLTPELLDRCGFTYRDDLAYVGWYSNSVDGISVRIFYEELSETFRYAVSITHSIWVESIHQLQNLYFAITETELEVSF